MVVTRTYEVAFLIKEGDISKTAVERIKTYFSKIKAEIKSESDIGTRQLAYAIRKDREDFHKAFYYFVKADIKTDTIPELERQIKFDEDIIRHMLLAEGQ